MGGVTDRQSLVATLGLTRRNVEHEVRPDDSGADLRARLVPTVLTGRIANATDVEMVFRDLNFAAHGDRLALVDAVGEGVFDEDLR